MEHQDQQANRQNAVSQNAKTPQNAERRNAESPKRQIAKTPKRRNAKRQTPKRGSLGN